MLPAPSDLEDSSDPQTEAAACFLSWSSGVAAFSRGQPGGSGGPSRHKGAEAVCMSVRYPLAGAWHELQLRTSAAGWRGGMPCVYSGIMHP